MRSVLSVNRPTPVLVAQVSNLLYRRFLIGSVFASPGAAGGWHASQAGSATIQQIRNLRHIALAATLSTFPLAGRPLQPREQLRAGDGVVQEFFGFLCHVTRSLVALSAVGLDVLPHICRKLAFLDLFWINIGLTLFPSHIPACVPVAANVIPPLLILLQGFCYTFGIRHAHVL
jgi:hypothetical protein